MQRGWLAALVVAGLVLSFAVGWLLGRVLTPFTSSEKLASSRATSSSSGLPKQSLPPIPPCDCYGPDLDCDDFDTQWEAQRCYEYCLQVRGFDVFNLDADRDGRACERLP